MSRKFILLTSIIAASAAVLPLRAGQEVSATSGMTESQIEDLGEIVEADGDFASKFRASLNVKGDYTSNARLTGRHDSSDIILSPVFEMGYTEILTEKLTLDLALKGELGLYGDNDDRDFAGYSFKATLDYHPFKSGPRFFVAAEPYRYDSLDLGELISQAVGLSVGTDYGYAFNNGHSLFFTGYSYTGYIADPASDTRNAHRIVIGITHQFRQNLTGSFFYAWQYTDFVNFDRHDSKHLIGANLIYQFQPNWFGTLSGSFADNDSDFSLSTYQAAGGSLGVTYQF